VGVGTEITTNSLLSIHLKLYPNTRLELNGFPPIKGIAFLMRKEWM